MLELYDLPDEVAALPFVLRAGPFLSIALSCSATSCVVVSIFSGIAVRSRTGCKSSSSSATAGRRRSWLRFSSSISRARALSLSISFPAGTGACAYFHFFEGGFFFLFFFEDLFGRRPQ